MRISLDEYALIGTYWIALYVNAKNVTYFDRFGVEHVSKEIRKFIGNEDIIKNKKIILKYSQENLNKLKCIVMFAINMKK